MIRGVSLLEFLLAVAIIALLVGVTLIPFANFRDEKLLDGAVADILSTLDEARTRTLSSDGDLTYGVSFGNDKMTLMPDERVTFLHNRLVISEVNLFGGTEVFFERLTGETANYGTLTVNLVSDPSRWRIIEISPAGSVGLK